MRCSTSTCVGCHSERVKTAGLSLQALDVAHVEQGAEAWEKVAAKLRTRTMPPPQMPQPDQAASTAFLSWLEHELDVAAAAAPNPGRMPIHRLNRPEYANAIRDLLALDIDGRVAAAGRRVGSRLRQHRRRADVFARLARALHDRGAEDQPSRHRRSDYPVPATETCPECNVYLPLQDSNVGDNIPVWFPRRYRSRALLPT